VNGDAETEDQKPCFSGNEGAKRYGKEYGEGRLCEYAFLENPFLCGRRSRLPEQEPLQAQLVEREIGLETYCGSALSRI
jgi:hypothetical protein